jgi:hypothetical protein
MILFAGWMEKVLAKEFFGNRRINGIAHVLHMNLALPSFPRPCLVSSDPSKLATLLRCWMNAAHAQKQPDLVAALELRIAALRHAEDGETMLKAFHDLER